MKRRVLAMLMAAALCVGLLPTTILAETGEPAEDAEESVEETAAQTADIEIAEDGTATVVLGDVEGEEEQEEAAEAEEPLEAEPDGEAEEAEEAEEEAEPEEVVYTGKDGSVSVKVTAPYGALPEGAELKVERFAKDSKEYKDAAEAIGLDEDDPNMAALEISFVADGEEVEPGEAVKVSIDASEILPEDADASSIEVQHLKEGRGGQVKAEVVANDSKETEGTIDAAEATAEFEVESFSTFTVTWDDSTGETGATITVHVYNMNGTSIDEELDVTSYTSTNGAISISDLVSHLEQNASYTSTYTFAYATVYYENTNNQGGFDPYTIGDEDNSVTQVSKSGTDYTVTYGGTAETVSNPYVITIHLYYSLPTVTLTATENDNTVDFTTESSYFTGDTSEAEYHWALSDDSYGSITPGNNDGTATFTWSEDAKTGDQVSVTVTMTIGNETASDTYTLIYGAESTTITVTLNGTAQANANVALVDEDGNTVATGKTGADGTVTLDVIPGTYTVGVTYVTYNTMGGGSTTRYTNSGTVTVGEDGTITGDTAVNLTSSVTSGPGNDTNGSSGTTWSSDGEYYYEHIDVKIAVAEGADEDAVFSDLDRIYVYDEYGNLIYYSLDLVENDDTTDYNTLFDVNGTEGHSLVVSSKDTIILVFEVYEDGEYKTYTETITPSTTYPEGEYYSYSDVNAYQLYNSIYGTSISENDWETALNNGTLSTLLGNNYNENGIDIGGMSFIQVADYLCDTRGTSGQAGLDFVIDVGVISVLYESYDLQIAKSLEGVPDSIDSVEAFEFTLQELSSVSDSNNYTEAIWNTANTIGDASSATTGEWTKEDDGTWSAIADFGDFLEYEAEEGTTLFYYILSEKDTDSATAVVQNYGIKVSVEYSSSTGIATVTASYCQLVETDEEGVYNRNSGWTELTAYTGEDEDGEYTYFSIPFVNTYDTITYSVDVYKYDSTTNEPLEYVTFMLWRISDDEEEAFADFTYDEGTGVNTVSAWVPAGTPLGNYNYQIVTDKEGYIHIAGLEPGEYWLEEQDPLQGYKRIEEPISFTISEDGTITSDYWSSDMSAIAIANSEEIINVRKTDDSGNPLEGAEFVMGWVWQPTQAISMPVEGTDYYYDYLTFNQDSDTDSNTYVFIPDGQVDTRDDATTLITDENGYIHLRELDTGVLYFLVETKAPDGYELFEDPIVFWVDYDGNMTLYLPQDDEHVSAEGDTITVVDDAESETFAVNIYKYDSTTNEALANASFVLGQTIDEENEQFADFTYDEETGVYTFSEWRLNNYGYAGYNCYMYSDKDGYIHIAGLEPGDYWLYETDPLEGYQRTEEHFNFTINEDGTVTSDYWSEDMSAIAIANSEEIINVRKTDTNGNPLGGAEFVMGWVWQQAQMISTQVGDTNYYYDYLTFTKDSDGTYVFNEEEQVDTRDDATTLTTDEDGYIHLRELYTNSLYFLIETKAPDGYTALEDPIVFWVDESGNMTLYLPQNDEHVSAEDDTITVVDDVETFDVLIYKYDGNEESEQFMSYRLKSNSAESYAASYYSALAGAEFSLSRETDNGSTEYAVATRIYDEEHQYYYYTISSWTEDEEKATTLLSDTDGYLEITNLEAGSYTLTETKAPAGYQLLTEAIVFAVDSDGNVSVVSGPAGIGTNSDGSTYITIANEEITVDISGSKKWVGDSESTRPTSITVNLYADDAEEPIDNVTVTSDDNWEWSFTDLPKYSFDDEGTATEIKYTVEEEAVSGSYIPTYEYDEDGNVTITNAMPELQKYVSDPSFGESTDDNLSEDEADNNDTLKYKLEADHIGGAHGLVLHDFLDDQLDISTLKIQSVILYADADDTGTTLVENEDYTLTTGECTVEDCNMDGCSFEIHIVDEDVENLSSEAYVVVIFDIDLVEGVEDFDAETYVDEIDNDLSLSFMAFSVTAWAEPVEVETFSYGFDLYKYDNETNEPLAGVEFVLSKSGDDGTVYAQFEVTDNTYLLSEWVDSEDDATPIVTGSDGKAVVEGLHDGTFSIKETKPLEGYEQKVGDITVTIMVDPDDPFSPTITATNATVDDLDVQIDNTPGEGLEIIGSKTWDDGDDADGVRPDSITIHLLADGEEVDSATVTADDNWAWSFKDMPQYQEDGTTEIVYTITEDAVDDYDTTISGYNVTNTHEPETRDISGSKTWEDDNDKADARPSSITVNLYQNGELYDSKTVTEDDDWAWSWTGLPKNANGEAIAYTITEDTVDYYDTTYYSGSFDITNTFVGEEGAEPGSGQGGDNPKTGDTNNLGTWLAMLVAAMACLLVGFRMRKRS